MQEYECQICRDFFNTPDGQTIINLSIKCVIMKNVKIIFCQKYKENTYKFVIALYSTSLYG